MGQFYASIGVAVTVVEATPQLLPGTEKDLVKVLQRRMKRMGMTILTGTMVKEVRAEGGLQRVVVEGKKGLQEITVERVLVTVGRRPLLRGLGLEALGLDTTAPHLEVNQRMETSLPHIYAAGDITGAPLLAHRASAQAEVAAENAVGHEAVYAPLSCPAVCYTTPEIATCGLTEAEAQAQGREVKVGKMSFGAIGRALVAGHEEGFVRYVADTKSDVILGVQIVGHEASELISEALVAIEGQIKARDLGSFIHAHPTLGEAAMEAAKAVHGVAIHMAPTRERGKR